MNNVVLIGSDTLGGRELQLGTILLSNFIRILSEQDDLPEYIVLWNSAVKEAVESSENLQYLRKLEERGVKVVLCRTCVDYFGIEEQLRVGLIDTMPNIQKILLNNNVLTV